MSFHVISPLLCSKKAREVNFNLYNLTLNFVFRLTVTISFNKILCYLCFISHWFFRDAEDCVKELDGMKICGAR